MQVTYAQPEKEAIHEVYNSIANNPDIKMTQAEASVISGILARTKRKAKTRDFTKEHLHSIELVLEQTIKLLENENEFEELNETLKNALTKTKIHVK